MRSNLRHILALNIRKHRYILGLSQAKLAESANVATAYIAMIELEKKFPSVDVLERIAYALKIDPTELFSKNDHPSEAIKEFHQLFLRDFERIVKHHIEGFETMVNNEKFVSNVPEEIPASMRKMRGLHERIKNSCRDSP